MAKSQSSKHSDQTTEAGKKVSVVINNEPSAVPTVLRQQHGDRNVHMGRFDEVRRDSRD